MLETMLGYMVDDCPMDSNVILPSMTINQDSKTPYTDATQVSHHLHLFPILNFVLSIFWSYVVQVCN
jgi:hypothetical protein